MRVRVQQEQKLLVTTKHALRCYDNTFIFTNQLEVNFGTAYIDWFCIMRPDHKRITACYYSVQF